jgi:hypothetical protein
MDRVFSGPLASPSNSSGILIVTVSTSIDLSSICENSTWPHSQGSSEWRPSNAQRGRFRDTISTPPMSKLRMMRGERSADEKTNWNCARRSDSHTGNSIPDRCGSVHKNWTPGSSKRRGYRNPAGSRLRMDGRLLGLARRTVCLGRGPLDEAASAGCCVGCASLRPSPRRLRLRRRRVALAGNQSSCLSGSLWKPQRCEPRQRKLHLRRSHGSGVPL